MKKRIASDDAMRIKSAISLARAPKLFSNPLTVRYLESVARFTNAAVVHYSGNCVLLATCLYANLLQNKKLLSVKNISPPTEGIDSVIAEEIILGASMATLATGNSLSKITAAILNEYRKTKTLFYKVSDSGYRVPFMGESGHEFNSVVIMDNGGPRVVYVDAWKTSQHTATEEIMTKRFGAGAIFGLKILESLMIEHEPPSPLKRQGARR